MQQTLLQGHVGRLSRTPEKRLQAELQMDNYKKRIETHSDSISIRCGKSELRY
ncbi:hypothetical protein Taro_009169, partial [Colocasia esculenta]|nr:hypothetical protein [Colocasia esculenta]